MVWKQKTNGQTVRQTRPITYTVCYAVGQLERCLTL